MREREGEREREREREREAREEKNRWKQGVARVVINMWKPTGKIK